MTSTDYVYFNYWGAHNIGYIDEFRISKVQRSEFSTVGSGTTPDPTPSSTPEPTVSPTPDPVGVKNYIRTKKKNAITKRWSFIYGRQTGKDRWLLKIVAAILLAIPTLYVIRTRAIALTFDR